ncbi:asparagine synthase (glutamine-hydrolyzing) [Nocardioides campestrisoli]|uniref:asparagine synthase (glutamine-hydrolyzing) n=1 Tax=Nocardioides campestrisoli TaxID=2736757 RepID=UPI00163D73E2|nr:asparagine synthase (glutamine-hydrolyzing) [Nocardioides campestrisoli]
MCGIGVIASLASATADHDTAALVDEMLLQLHHRGPDETSTRIEPQVGFAFARLSLVGIANGSQPLATGEDDLVLVANGEVYNHRSLESRLGITSELRTLSDCEVLLHQYRRHGLDFLDDVRGMFAVILWDRRNQKLVLARDRFGIKPLYFHRSAERIVAASEIKALMVDPGTPREVDWTTALGHPQLIGAPQFDQDETCTWFKGIESVPAGTILEIDLRDGSTRSHRYWSLPEPNEDWSEQRFVDEYRDALVASVRECATADAELGLFLSGGIDSTAVLALADSQDIHTFSAVTAGTLLNGDVEEAAWVAGKYGNPHHQVEFPHDLTPSTEQWRRVLWLSETPLCGPEVYYRYELHRFARQARPELRGMLLGSASDEFNGGYSVNTAGEGGWERFRRNLEYLADRTDLPRAAASSWRTDYSLPLVRPHLVREAAGSTADAYARYLRSEHLKVQQYNVWHDDRTAAGSSTEARVPFLDHRLVEISTSVPDRLRPALLWDKAILRRAMEGLVPERSRVRGKVPFFYGAGVGHTHRMMMRMLRAEDGLLVERALAAPGSADHLEGDNVRALLSVDGRDAELAEKAEIVLRLVNLGLLSELAREVPKVSRMPAGPVRQRVAEDVSGQDLAARLGVVEAADSLPPGRYRMTEGVTLLRDELNPTGFLMRGGELLYEFDATSPTFSALRGLASGDALDETLQGQPAEVADDVRDDVLELHRAGLLEATVEAVTDRQT